MIKKTIIKETKELIRDGRIRGAGFIVLLLLGVSVWISSNQYQQAREQVNVAQNAERTVWENQGEKNPHSAGHYGTFVFKPKHPLSLIDEGVDKYAGTTIFLESHNRHEAQYSKVADQTGLARFGELSPDFILLFIIPLLIILMGYNSFTKEREMGTLNLLKSQGAVFWKIIIGKWVALLLPISLIVLLLFAVAGISLSLIEEYVSFSWISLIILFLVYLMYYVIFTDIVLFVSQQVKNSGISLVILLSIWIVACLAAPKAASNFAEYQDPFPTRQEFAINVQEAKSKGLDGHNPWSEESKKLEKKVLEEYGVPTIQELPFNFNGYRMQKAEEHEAAVYKEQYGILKRKIANQNYIYSTLAVVSPFLPTRFLSMGIAGTDYHSHENFSDAAEDYRLITQKFLNDDLAFNTTYEERGYLADEETWKKLPKFRYQPLSLVEVIKIQQLNLGFLFSWVLITLFLMFFSRKSN